MGVGIKAWVRMLKAWRFRPSLLTLSVKSAKPEAVLLVGFQGLGFRVLTPKIQNSRIHIRKPSKGPRLLTVWGVPCF